MNREESQEWKWMNDWIECPEGEGKTFFQEIRKEIQPFKSLKT